MATGDGTYITVASVRRTVGISSTSTISDEDIGAFITEAEAQVQTFYNTVFTPREIIETQEGNDTYRLMLFRNPVLSVRDLYINNSQESTSTLRVYRNSGKIELTNDSTSGTFQKTYYPIIIKYVYGYLDISDTTTDTDAASTSGTSVALSVLDESDFSTGDWVQIQGMDGNIESAKITSTSTGQITVDQLVYSHESGSNVIKLTLNPLFTKLMNIAAALGIVAREVGQSSTDTTGYNFAEFRVQKGEPYTQWRETAIQLTKDRDDIMSRLKARPMVV